MKRRVLAVMLATVLCFAMSTTAFAAHSPSGSAGASTGHSSSKKSSSSSSSAKASVTVKTLGEVAQTSVAVSVLGADGSVTQSNLKEQSTGVKAGFESYAAAVAASGADAGAALSAALSRPASPVWQATINALGGQIKLNDCGAYSVKATAPAADGSVIASAGVVSGATEHAFMILVGVAADGSMEIVEGFYDAASGTVIGAFTNAPTVINALIITAA